MCWWRSFLRTSASSLTRGILIGIARDFEHILMPAALDQKRDRARTLSQALEDAESAREDVAFLGCPGVGDILMRGRGQLVLDRTQQFQEIGGRVDPAGDFGMGRELDQVLKGLAGTVDDRADP